MYSNPIPLCTIWFWINLLKVLCNYLVIKMKTLPKLQMHISILKALKCMHASKTHKPSDSLDQWHRVIQHQCKLKITETTSSYWFIVKSIKDFIYRTSELFFNNRNRCLRRKRRNLILNIKRRIITHYTKQRQTAASICYEFKRIDGKYKTCSHFNKLIDIIIAR